VSLIQLVMMSLMVFIVMSMAKVEEFLIIRVLWMNKSLTSPIIDEVFWQVCDIKASVFTSFFGVFRGCSYLAIVLDLKN